MIQYAYNKVDQDGNGRVDITELRAFLQELNGNEEVTEEEAQFVKESARAYSLLLKLVTLLQQMYSHQFLPYQYQLLFLCIRGCIADQVVALKRT